MFAPTIVANIALVDTCFVTPMLSHANTIATKIRTQFIERMDLQPLAYKPSFQSTQMHIVLFWHKLFEQ